MREVIDATRHVNKELPVYLDREKLKSRADQFKKVLENLEKDSWRRPQPGLNGRQNCAIFFELRRSRERKANGTGKS